VVTGLSFGLRQQVGLVSNFLAISGERRPIATKRGKAADASRQLPGRVLCELNSALAPALTLARILALAGVLLRFATALPFAAILTLTGVLAALRVVELLGTTSAIESYCAFGLAVRRRARDDSGDCCCH